MSSNGNLNNGSAAPAAASESSSWSKYNDPQSRPSQGLTSEAIRFFTPTYHQDTYDAISPRNFNLSGKSVLITGASKGIGRTTAIRFALAGCSSIAIAARTTTLLTSLTAEILSAAKEAGHPPPNVLELTLDVSSPSSVESAAKTLSSEFDNKLDILIANAAASYDLTQPLAESDVNGWLNTLTVSVSGTYLCARYFIPLLLNSSLKTFIGLSSIGALNINPCMSGYQVAKMGVTRLVEFIDQEYWRQGVIAVSIHPGGVDTELARTLPEEFHSFLVDTPQLAGDWMVWFAEQCKPENGTGERKGEWLAGRFVFVNWDVEELQLMKEDVVEKNLLKFRMAV
ncbi:C-factor [Rhypophila sp. PSN 637]